MDETANKYKIPIDKSLKTNPSPYGTTPQAINAKVKDKIGAII
jgi:hypothetical protein